MQNAVQIAYNMNQKCRKHNSKEGKQMLQDRYITKCKNLYSPTI